MELVVESTQVAEVRDQANTAQSVSEPTDEPSELTTTEVPEPKMAEAIIEEEIVPLQTPSQEINSVQPNQEAIPFLQPGILMPATLERSETDQYVFDGLSDQVVDIVALPQEPLEPLFNLSIELIRPNGSRLVIADKESYELPEAILGQRLPESGPYQILVYEAGNDQQGKYVLVLLTETSKASSDRRLERGNSINSSLQKANMDHWVFEGSAGEIVSILLNLGNNHDASMKLVLEVYDPQGNQLEAENNQGIQGSEGRNVYELTEDGIYTIWVYDHQWRNSGDYSLSIQ